MKTKYDRMPAFEEAQEVFVMQGLACGMSYRDIAGKIILLWEDYNESHRKQLLMRVGRVATSDKTRDYIRMAREGWEKECADVPIAIRKIRLQRMEQEYHRLETESIEKVIVTPDNRVIDVYRQNTPMMLKLLDQARVEMSEVNKPTQSAPMGKAEGGLKINMRGDNIFSDAEESQLKDKKPSMAV